MFYQIFLPPQVKRWPIITYKHGIYVLPQELPNNLRLKILGNCLNPIESLPGAQSPHKNETFVNTSRKLLKNRKLETKLSP